MPWYSVSTRVIIDHLRQTHRTERQVWLADDAAGTGSIKDPSEWYDALNEYGRKMGYFVNGRKGWLILKDESMMATATEYFGEKVSITSGGQRHLRAVIGTQDYKDQY